MVIYKNIIEFVILPCDSIRTALTKIEKNKHKIVYVVDEKNHLLGCLADGDYRRWSLRQSVVDLNVSVEKIYNKKCFSLHVEVSGEEIDNYLSLNNRSIPLVDDANHILAIAEKGANFLVVDGRRISDEDPAFIIAEIGNNHQGDKLIARSLIDSAVDAGVDCVKFQMRRMDVLYGKGRANSPDEDLGSQYTLDLLSKFQLSDQDLFEMFDYCKSKGVTPLCTPWDLESLEVLEGCGMTAYKVSSADFTNHELLNAIAATGKPMLCSTGMSSDDEIRNTVKFLERKKAQYILLHCNSTYPTPFKDVNLRYMARLKKITKGVIGYSGHERGWSVPVAAIVMGAKVIEKHLTTNRSLEGADHKVSLLPYELELMVGEIKNVEAALGSDEPRFITQGELMNRDILAKSLVAKNDIPRGESITREDIDIRSPGKGIQPDRIGEFLGRPALRDIQKGEFLFESDISEGIRKSERYQFNRPYGIPVRYHDYKNLTQGVDLDFVEFHLSYKDLDLKPDDFISHHKHMRFAVHAPELFAGDHLLDLGSCDESYRQASIIELQRVIDHTNRLKRFFPKEENPVLVVNAGGWDVNGFLTQKVIQKKYELVRQSLSSLDTSGVDVAIQTMPPFPWHFGGQSYHNLFVKPDEIASFCQATGFGVCLDVSHTMMAANYFKWDLYDTIASIAPYISHLHIVDALGVDGEGVQIGEGDVDFLRLGRLLDKVAPNVQFIPEVWQGHKNMGEGFWRALTYLEKQLHADIKAGM